jgi:hypothetical protein
MTFPRISPPRRILCILIILTTMRAYGDDMSIAPTVSMEQRYRDNIFFDADSSDQEGDAIRIVSPGIRLRDRTERLDADLFARCSYITYRDNTELNTTDRYASSSLAYRFSPRSGISLQAGYTDDSQSDRDLGETGLVLGTSRRIMRNYEAACDTAVTETTSLRAGLSFRSDDFEDPGYTDSDSSEVSLGVWRSIACIPGETLLFVNAGYRRVSYEDSLLEKADTATLSFGLQSSFTETLGATAYVGSRRSVSRYEDLPFPFDLGTERDHGFVGQLLITQTTEYGERSINLTHDIGVVSGESTQTERTSLLLIWRRNWIEDLSTGISAGFYLNKADRGSLSTRDIDEESFRVNPWLSYRYDRSWSLRGSYEYYRLRDDADGSVARSNTISLRAVWEYDMSDWIRSL